MSCLVTEHLDSHVRANDSAQGASSTFAVLALFFFYVLGRVIASDIELVAYSDASLGACSNAQATPFAQVPVDSDESLLQKSISCESFKLRQVPPKCMFCQ
jgi:hypothetical protein